MGQAVFQHPLVNQVGAHSFVRTRDGPFAQGYSKCNSMNIELSKLCPVTFEYFFPSFIYPVAFSNV